VPPLLSRYQTSGDDTFGSLQRHRPSEIPQLVLNAPGDVVGRVATSSCSCSKRSTKPLTTTTLLRRRRISVRLRTRRTFCRHRTVAELRGHSLVLPLGRTDRQVPNTNLLAGPVGVRDVPRASFRSADRRPTCLFANRSLLEPTRSSTRSRPTTGTRHHDHTHCAEPRICRWGKCRWLRPPTPSKSGNS